MNKTCGCCGKVHLEIPESGIYDEMGVWFNCVCDSTLLIRKSNLIKIFEIEADMAVKFELESA